MSINQKANGWVQRVTVAVGLALGTALLLTVTGCVGVVGDGGGDVAVGVPGPDVVLFGGGYYGHGFDRGRDVHAYSARGAASRGFAHPGGGGRGGRR